MNTKIDFYLSNRRHINTFLCNQRRKYEYWCGFWYSQYRLYGMMLDLDRANHYADLIVRVHEWMNEA